MVEAESHACGCGCEHAEERSSLTALAVSLAFGASQGAVKTPLWEGENQVGWVVLNTDCDGHLIVVVHLDQGRGDEDFATVAVICGTVSPALGTLTTNGQGKGNLHSKVDLPPDAEGSTSARVHLTPESAGRPLYTTDVVEVPVKTPRDG